MRSGSLLGAFCPEYFLIEDFSIESELAGETADLVWPEMGFGSPGETKNSLLGGRMSGIVCWHCDFTLSTFNLFFPLGHYC